MIRDGVIWLAVSDAVAAAALGLIVYVVGRRSAHPVSAGTAVGLGALFALPGALLYGLVLVFGG